MFAYSLNCGTSQKLANRCGRNTKTDSIIYTPSGPGTCVSGEAFRFSHRHEFGHFKLFAIFRIMMVSRSLRFHRINGGSRLHSQVLTLRKALYNAIRRDLVALKWHCVISVTAFNFISISKSRFRSSLAKGSASRTWQFFSTVYSWKLRHLYKY